ncbi:hypothetical protein [Tessaracoccus aquimaris]|uniref:hypothetical protein n=1 Tax=Tessaracoccus aquimaris TaxID=1332264 RepID=UPI001D0423B8|nr:hypothetical protein [Tessaracoccus aquimaris]
MTEQTLTEPVEAERTAVDATRRSWVPMIGLFLAQVLMSFNVAALPISLGGMVKDFGVPRPSRARPSWSTASPSPRS